MRLKLGLVAALVLSLGLVGCRSKEQIDADSAAKKGELDKLQGKWKVVSRTGDEDEDEDAEPAEPNAYYVIEGDLMKFVYKGADGKTEEYGRKKMSLMADKEPKQVDLTYVDEAGKPMKERKVKKGITGKKKTSTTDMKDVAVYKVEGDKLTMAISYDEKNRPTGFTTAKGTSSYVLTLERIKDGTEKAAETPAAAPASPETVPTAKSPATAPTAKSPEAVPTAKTPVTVPTTKSPETAPTTKSPATVPTTK